MFAAKQRERLMHDGFISLVAWLLKRTKFGQFIASQTLSLFQWSLYLKIVVGADIRLMNVKTFFLLMVSESRALGNDNLFLS